MRALILALAACLAPGAGIDVPGYDRVYACFAGELTKELCWYGDAASLASELGLSLGGTWLCGPTQRHSGPCVYCCENCSRGANAFDGSYCP